jgi:hypothetical protein
MFDDKSVTATALITTSVSFPHGVNTIFRHTKNGAFIAHLVGRVFYVQQQCPLWATNQHDYAATAEKIVLHTITGNTSSWRCSEADKKP